MRYRVEHRIATLTTMTTSAVLIAGKISDTVQVDTITFWPWDLGPEGRYRGDFWLAEMCIEADNFREVGLTEWGTLQRVIPRLALVTQTYADFVREPYLILREDRDVCFLRFTRESSPVGLMFGDEEFEALKLLLAQRSIRNEFYFYWNDAVNAVGYTAKLLLMLAAIEALARGRTGCTGRNKTPQYWDEIRKILGDDVTVWLFGEKGASQGGLRHRLAHGEYFQNDDGQRDYLELIHKRVLSYFNEQVIGKPLLSLDVTDPQRHFWGGKQGGSWFIRRKGRETLNLRAAVKDFETNGVNGLKDHELVDPWPSDY
jgi:hypothetical protein